MNLIKRVLAVLLVLTSVLGALAAETVGRSDGSRRIRVDRISIMLGTTVLPGWYTLKWTREDATQSVKIEISDERSVVASGKGVWIASTRPSPYESLVYRASGEGLELSEIRFRKSADAIRVMVDTEGDGAKE